MKLFKYSNIYTVIIFQLGLCFTHIHGEDVFNDDNIFGDFYTECGKNEEDTGYIFKSSLNTNEKNRPGKWPWLVSMGLKSDTNVWEHRCGGSLVTPSQVVTAAHCPLALNKEIRQGKIYIRAGDSHLRNDSDDAGVQIVKVVNFTTHPDYKWGRRYWDIGVLKLEHPMELTEVARTICLPSDSTLRQEEDDLHLVVTGWGEDNLSQVGRALYHANVQVYSETYCNRTHLGFPRYKMALPFGFTSDLFCGGDVAEAEGVCDGDSGSPAVFFASSSRRFILKGVVSGGLSCGTKVLPNIYVRITNQHILNWVYLQINTAPNNIVSVSSTTAAELTSISPPSRCNITIFTKTYNRGNHQTFTDDQVNLGVWDNKVVSLKVNGECCWRVFTEVNYGGNSKDFCERAYNRVTDIGFLFKDASSVKLIF